VQVGHVALSWFGIESYFERINATTDEETRDADKAEVSHIVHVAIFAFETLWKAKGAAKHPLKERVANSVFFDAFERAPMNGTATALK
jgi:hypothetical protein